MKTKLKQYRVRAGMTQAKLAKKVGVTQPNYQRWESGSAPVPEEKLNKLAKVLETSPEALLARIMHHGTHFRTSARRTRAVGRSDRTGVQQLANTTRLGLIGLARRRIGARCPAAHPLDGARRSATARNSRPSEHLVGNCMRMP